MNKQELDDHTSLALVMQRLEYLEAAHERNAEKIAQHEKKLSYYDRNAIKWGSFCLGMLSFGAVMTMGFDKLKEKILHWVMSW